MSVMERVVHVMERVVYVMEGVVCVTAPFIIPMLSLYNIGIGCS